MTDDQEEVFEIDQRILEENEVLVIQEENQKKEIYLHITGHHIQKERGLVIQKRNSEIHPRMWERNHMDLHPQVWAKKIIRLEKRLRNKLNGIIFLIDINKYIK
ncbi:MAG: hypothetical protein WCL18_09945 [bacterium]